MSSQQIAKQAVLKPLLLASQRQIQSLLQDDAKAKRFMAASLVVASSPALNNCSPDSIVQALIGVATRGGAEWLKFRREDGSVEEVRLDQILAFEEKPGAA